MGDGGAVAGQVVVEGFNELQRAFARADKESRRDVRKVMRGIAEPTKKAIESLALSDIHGLGATRNPKWQKMRIGVTRNLVYIVPREKARLSRQNPARYQRRNWRNLLIDRAMDPAAGKYRHTYEAAVAHAFDQIADRFNSGGAV